MSPLKNFATQLHQLCAFFHAGEESVTSTLAPLLGAAARLKLGVDIECYLTSQIYEEARHFEFFTRYFHEVLGEDTGDLLRELTAAPQAVLIDDLDATTDRVRAETDPDRLRAAMVEAVTHYMGVVEAMLARTGYVGASDALASRNWLPGLQEGFRLIRRDEGRHVSFGIHFIRQMTTAHPELVPVVQATFERHLPMCSAPFRRSTLRTRSWILANSPTTRSTPISSSWVRPGWLTPIRLSWRLTCTEAFPLCVSKISVSFVSSVSMLLTITRRTHDHRVTHAS
ncbi:MAG: hypothetical protein HC937_02390 [Aquincola sp.]|nr:hypothetical protein [Aquincola sp.]